MGFQPETRSPGYARTLREWVSAKTDHREVPLGAKPESFRRAKGKVAEIPLKPKKDRPASTRGGIIETASKIWRLTSRRSPGIRQAFADAAEGERLRDAEEQRLRDAEEKRLRDARQPIEAYE